MGIPTNIETLLNGNIVESARLELKKIGIQRLFYTQFVLLQMI